MAIIGVYPIFRHTHVGHFPLVIFFQIALRFAWRSWAQLRPRQPERLVFRVPRRGILGGSKWTFSPKHVRPNQRTWKCIYIYMCAHMYIYMHLYIYNLATHLNLELTHHNCVGFTEGPNRYHRWLDYILILGVMKVHSTPMLYWWRRCVCVVVFVRFYLCEIDFAGPVMQLSMSLLFSWKLSRLIILTIINIAKDILLRSHLLIIWMWVKMEDLGDHRCECLV